MSAMPPKSVQDFFDRARQRGSDQKTGIVSNDPINKKNGFNIPPKAITNTPWTFGTGKPTTPPVLAAVPLPARANKDEQLRADPF